MTTRGETIDVTTCLARVRDDLVVAIAADQLRSRRRRRARFGALAIAVALAISVSAGHDGGFLFGRVGAESAVTVEIAVPNGGGTLRRPVAEERFFLADFPPKAWRALTADDGTISHPAWIEAITVTAKDAQGSVVARSTVGEWPPPDVPTETAATP